MAVAPDSSFRKRETNLDIFYLLLSEQFGLWVGFKLSACSPSMHPQFRRSRLISSKHGKY
jgi:hypothetical protein